LAVDAISFYSLAEGSRIADLHQLLHLGNSLEHVET